MEREREKGDKPAFFSCNVNSAQLTFIRSRNAIHKSACSCGGNVSHLFSIFASVGLEIACACLVCAPPADRTTPELARTELLDTAVRSIVRGMETKGIEERRC
jgi:hypothetical protein